MKFLLQNPIAKLLSIVFLSLLISACNNANEQHGSENSMHGHADENAEVIKGAHGGRLLNSGDFTLELAIFETGVPPEFRAWASFKGQAVSPNEVNLHVTLTRLSSHDDIKTNKINFTPAGDALRGDSVIYEPHSFTVSINATYNGDTHHWQYDTFEGRTKIETAVADALEIKSEIAGPVMLKETVNVFGKIAANTERVSHLSARFAGVIKSVKTSIGERVRKGQTLATIESNESLNVYAVKAPIDGIITQRNANPGEQTGNNALFVITDTSRVWVDLSIFPKDMQRVKVGSQVSIEFSDMQPPAQGTISFIDVIAKANQSTMARVVIDNKDGQLLPGHTVTAKINVGEYAVALAVKRSGLQAFRDFTVVYAQVGEEYEVRMLELGKQNNIWVEVLGGLKTGTRYVTENSYVVKADIEKSGASHDH